MKKELDAAIELYQGMPLAGRTHWRERALPSIRFENEEERKKFVEDLDRIDEGEEPQNLS